jgi:hypothetical protein
MMDAVKTLFGSKKFLATVIGAVAAVLCRLGLPEEMAQDMANTVLGLFGTFVLGQGVADHGKEKAKQEAKNAQAGHVRLSALLVLLAFLFVFPACSLFSVKKYDENTVKNITMTIDWTRSRKNQVISVYKQHGLKTKVMEELFDAEMERLETWKIAEEAKKEEDEKEEGQ